MPGEHTVCVSAVGDISFADSAYCVGHGLRSIIERTGQEVFEARLRSLFEEADVRFGNLEAVHSDCGRHPLVLATVEMRGNPRHLSLLSAGGFNVVNVANNHIFQHGLDAYRDTVSRLERMGVAVVGDHADGRSRVASLSVRGVPLHFVGFSLRPEQYYPKAATPYDTLQRSEIVRRVAGIRKELQGHLVCSLHWGHEYLDTASRQQQEFARALIDAGVTLVLGHHPHVLQGIERYRHGLIAYSLGNFAFDLRAEAARDSVCLYVDLDDAGVADWYVQPLWLSDDGWPERCDAKESDRIRGKIEELSARLGGPLPEEAVLAVEERARLRERSRWTHRYFLRHLRRYSVLVATQSVGRAALRRMGVLRNP